MPDWLRGDVLDVRKVVLYQLNQESPAPKPAPRLPKVNLAPSDEISSTHLPLFAFSLWPSQGAAR